ncbi:MAG TPA: VWA domain-containing protein [Thermoanaerobaculia bacterium]|nr:VWA domain-containing protein [Thermoanaerobaculia bacterium]
MALSIRWTTAAAVSLCLSLSANAQEAPRPPQEQVFGETIDVRVVNVEAVVTDRVGKRVPGLKAGDFRLLVDGKEVPVEYFAEVAEGSAVSASGSGGPVTPGEEVGRNYLVFIDESVSIPSQRDDLLKRLKLDLNLLRPADRMAVLAFDGLHIEILSPWTHDATALAAALDQALQRPAHGAMTTVHREAPQSEVNLILDSAAILDDGDSSGPSIVGTELTELEGDAVSTDAYTDAHKTADAAASALRAFEAPPGRKVMLLVSGAWTLQSAPRFYGPVLGAANRLGYSVYPVDSAQSGTFAIKAADKLARFTGGTALAPFDNRFFKAAVQETGSYYWLGFTPSWKANDRTHRVTVTVQGRWLEVRSRHGFSDLSKSSEAALRTESVLLFGGTQQERRLFVKLGAPHRRGRELEVPVTLGVPFEALAMAPRGKGYMAEVPLSLAAMDEKGGRSNLRTRLKVAVGTLPKAGNYVRFQTVIRLSDLGQRLVFTVPDSQTGRSIWGDANIERSK